MTRAANLAEAAGSGFAFRNRIINGRFDIWQRGTSAVLISDANPFLADRWGANQFQQGRHQKVAVTSPPSGLNAKYALQVGSSTTAEASGGTRMVASQTIESVNCQDLAGQQVTFSFWVKFNSATFNSVANSGNSAFGNFTSAIAFFTSTTDAASRTTGPDSSVLASLINGALPTTWTKVTLTATVPSGTNNILARVGFDYQGSTSSADQNFYHITQVQLEPGTIATPFEFRPYGAELALCQRYFQYDTNGGSAYHHLLPACFAASTYAYALKTFQVEMRAAPTATFSAGNTFLTDGATQVTPTSLSSAGYSSTRTYRITLNFSGGGVAGQGFMLAGAGSGTALITYSAEL